MGNGEMGKWNCNAGYMLCKVSQVLPKLEEVGPDQRRSDMVELY